jgi:branched-chain amino acid transport system substrate-binding protein
MQILGKTGLAIVSLIALISTTAARAQQEIKIGVIYPLTGSLAASGSEMRSALELAADIINNGAPSAPDLSFSAGGGLPNLKGAKIKLVFADHQGNPQVGATEAERLIRHRQPGGRTQPRALREPGVLVAVAHATRLQVVLPHHAAR